MKAYMECIIFNKSGPYEKNQNSAFYAETGGVFVDPSCSRLIVILPEIVAMSYDTATADALIARLSFDERGLIPAIAQAHTSGEVLMLAWMNADAIRETLSTGQVTYWSRSRNALWRKGETSGHVQTLRNLRFDCDADALLLEVEQTGPACHTNRPNCFYTQLEPHGFRTLSEPLA